MAAKLAARVSDPELSSLGYKQAEVLGEYLSHLLKGDKYEIISSPMRRTLLTILPFARQVEKEIIVLPNFYEFPGCHKLGVTFPGSTQQALEKIFPVRCLPGMENGWFHGHDKKETVAEVDKRVKSLWDWIYSELPSLISPATTAVMVGHGKLFHALVSHFLGCSSSVPQPVIVHANIGISEIHFVHVEGYGWSALVKALNKTWHIPDNLRTGDKDSNRWEKVLRRFCRKEKNEEKV